MCTYMKNQFFYFITINSIIKESQMIEKYLFQEHLTLTIKSYDMKTSHDSGKTENGKDCKYILVTNDLCLPIMYFKRSIPKKSYLQVLKCQKRVQNTTSFGHLASRKGFPLKNTSNIDCRWLPEPYSCNEPYFVICRSGRWTYLIYKQWATLIKSEK